MTTPAAARASGGRGGGFAGAAGLRSRLRITQSIHVLAKDQELAAGTERLQMAGVDPAANRHVTHTEFGSRSLNGQQFVLFHAADRTASRKQDNTLVDFTGMQKTCIIHSQVRKECTDRRLVAPPGSARFPGYQARRNTHR